MKKASLIPLLLLLLVTGCRDRTSRLTELSKAIRQTPQTAFPGAQDRKWQLIRDLVALKDEPALPDTLVAQFAAVDTNIRGYYSHYNQLLRGLADPHSAHSLSLLAGLYRKYQIQDPGCSQVLTDMLYGDHRVQTDLIASYLDKQDHVDLSPVIRHLDRLFPDLATVLGKRPFTDRPVLDLLRIGIAGKTLNATNLGSSRGELLRYYAWLKFARDSLAERNTGGYSYKGYYEAHAPDLIQVLQVFEGDTAVARVLQDYSDQSGKKLSNN